MFQRLKSLRQAAALPFVWTADGYEVLLVTSRRRKRWIIPKGQPIKGLSLADVAAREAEEEAGVIGALAAEALGAYDYVKASDGYRVNCRVFVFPLLVVQQRLDWKERGQRKARWVPLAAAADLIAEKGLAALMRDIARAPNSLDAFTDAYSNRSLASCA